MRRILRITAIAIAVSLAMGMTAARAEDSGVFKNPGNISHAQSILESEGYLTTGSYTPGRIDQATRQAISDYQNHHALNHSGNLDDDTYEMLLSHEISYPWDNGENAQAKMAPAEPVAPVTAPAPPAEVQVAEAAPVPEPAPPVVEVKEAPAPAPAQPDSPMKNTPRKMPSTASHLPLLALSGLGLMGLGILVIFRKTA
jgi:hypothetical protein